MKPSNYGSTVDNYHENTLDVDYKTKMKVIHLLYIFSFLFMNKLE